MLIACCCALVPAPLQHLFFPMWGIVCMMIDRYEIVLLFLATYASKTFSLSNLYSVIIATKSTYPLSIESRLTTYPLSVTDVRPQLLMVCPPFTIFLHINHLVRSISSRPLESSDSTTYSYTLIGGAQPFDGWWAPVACAINRGGGRGSRYKVHHELDSPPTSPPDLG